MEDQEDGVVSVLIMDAIMRQGGIAPDDIMAARMKRLEQEKLDEVRGAFPIAMSLRYMKLLRIIAYMYQVAGACDLPEHILDVLSDPEGATEKQIDALLPFQAQS